MRSRRDLAVLHGKESGVRQKRFEIYDRRIREFVNEIAIGAVNGV